MYSHSCINFDFNFTLSVQQFVQLCIKRHRCYILLIILYLNFSIIFRQLRLLLLFSEALLWGFQAKNSSRKPKVWVWVWKLIKPQICFKLNKQYLYIYIKTNRLRILELFPFLPCKSVLLTGFVKSILLRWVIPKKNWHILKFSKIFTEVNTEQVYHWWLKYSQSKCSLNFFIYYKSFLKWKTFPFKWKGMLALEKTIMKYENGILAFISAHSFETL